MDTPGTDSPPTQENFDNKIFPFDKYFLWVSVFRKTLSRIPKTTNQLIHKTYLQSANKGVSAYVFQLAADPILYLPWKGILHKKKSQDQRLYKFISPGIVPTACCQVSLLYFWVHRLPVKDSSWEMINVFRFLIFPSDIPNPLDFSMYVCTKWSTHIW